MQSCEICQEPFETYWVEEEEDWFLKDALRVDDKVRNKTAAILNLRFDHLFILFLSC